MVLLGELTPKSVGDEMLGKRQSGRCLFMGRNQKSSTYFNVQAFRRFDVLGEVQPLLSSYRPHVGGQRLFVLIEPLHLWVGPTDNGYTRKIYRKAC